MRLNALAGVSSFWKGGRGADGDGCDDRAVHQLLTAGSLCIIKLSLVLICITLHITNAMHTLSLPYPDDLLIASGKSPQALEAELAFLLAVKLFELRRLSLGKAAEFCHMPKLKFMYELGQLQIPVINLDDDQISDELADD